MLQHTHIEAGQETLVAVVVGAFLATAGGFVASQLERLVHRKENERSAALLFGEILSSLKLIVQLADESRRRGDPYGPITMRMVRGAQREAVTYDRNREALFNLRDAMLRAKVHALMVRIMLSLDGIFDSHEEILAFSTSKSQADGADERWAARLEALEGQRKGAFDFLVQLNGEIPALMAKLQRVAKYSFEAHEELARRELNAQFGVRPAG